MTPLELTALADLRQRGQAPELSVVLVDDWNCAPRLADGGFLAIRVNPANDWDCDWSPLAGLWVILAQWRTSLRDETRLACAVLAANPRIFETLEHRRGGYPDQLGAVISTIVLDTEGWMQRTRARGRRDELLFRLMRFGMAA